PSRPAPPASSPRGRTPRAPRGRRHTASATGEGEQKILNPRGADPKRPVHPGPSFAKLHDASQPQPQLHGPLLVQALAGPLTGGLQTTLGLLQLGRDPRLLLVPWLRRELRGEGARRADRVEGRDVLPVRAAADLLEGAQLLAGLGGEALQESRLAVVVRGAELVDGAAQAGSFGPKRVTHSVLVPLLGSALLAPPTADEPDAHAGDQRERPPAPACPAQWCPMAA